VGKVGVCIIVCYCDEVRCSRDQWSRRRRYEVWSDSQETGHVEGGTKSGRTLKKPKDVSACESEERGRREDGGVYASVMESLME